MMKLKTAVTSLTLLITVSSAASAALTAVFTEQATNGDPHIGTISATTGDLLATQGSVGTYTEFANNNTGGTLVDSAISTVIPPTNTYSTLFKGGTGEFITFNLNTTVNTLGYDLTNIRTIASWTDRRAGQAWTVQVSLVGSSSFADLFTLTPAAGEASGGGVSLVSLADGGSVFATGVDAIRFNFADVKNGGGTLNWAAYRELDVIGSATAIPEPAAALLGCLGMLLLLRRRR